MRCHIVHLPLCPKAIFCELVWYVHDTSVVDENIDAFFDRVEVDDCCFDGAKLREVNF